MIMRIVEATKGVNIILQFLDTNVPAFQDTAKLTLNVFYQIAQQIHPFVT